MSVSDYRWLKDTAAARRRRCRHVGEVERCSAASWQAFTKPSQPERRKAAGTSDGWMVFSSLLPPTCHMWLLQLLLPEETGISQEKDPNPEERQVLSPPALLPESIPAHIFPLHHSCIYIRNVNVPLLSLSLSGASPLPSFSPLFFWCPAGDGREDSLCSNLLRVRITTAV